MWAIMVPRVPGRLPNSGLGPSLPTMDRRCIVWRAGEVGGCTWFRCATTEVRRRNFESDCEESCDRTSKSGGRGVGGGLRPRVASEPPTTGHALRRANDVPSDAFICALRAAKAFLVAVRLCVKWRARARTFGGCAHSRRGSATPQRFRSTLRND